MNPWQIFAQEAQTSACTDANHPVPGVSANSEYLTTTPTSSTYHSAECDLLWFEDIEDQNKPEAGLPYRPAMQDQQERQETEAASVTTVVFSLVPNHLDPKASLYAFSSSGPSAQARPCVPEETVPSGRSREEGHPTASDSPAWLLDIMNETHVSRQGEENSPMVRYTKDEMHEIKKAVSDTGHQEGIQAGRLINMFIALEKSSADEQQRDRGNKRYHNTYYARSRSYSGQEAPTRLGEGSDRKERRWRDEGGPREWVPSEEICIDWDDYHDNPVDVESKVIFVPIRGAKNVPEDAQGHGFHSGVPIISAVSPLLCSSCKRYTVV